jgi:hypothetical protein
MSMFFLVIALISSAFLGVQLLLLMFGADMDFDADIDVDAGDLGGFLSVRSLTAFFGGFGWGGLAARQAGWGGAASVATGVGVGAAMFVVVGFLFVAARKLTSSGGADYSSAVGSTASVYVRIPPARSGSGKVELTLSGRVSIVNAVTDNESEIPTHMTVRVVGLSSPSTMLVEPV